MGSPGSSYFVGPADQPDKYRLLQQVGGGGEAQLWQASIPVGGEEEPVAVKILRADRMGNFAQLSARWAEQAEVLRFLRHPGVVGVREHFEGSLMHIGGEAGSTAGKSLYLVMNWVDGHPLKEVVALSGGTRQSVLQLLHHLEQVAEVLDWLHSGEATPSGRPVVHGDLSAGNVMISPTGQAVLVDFGLARLVAHQTEQAAGTPGYAAPEVWLSGHYSPAGDRYGFGAITYFAITGSHPTFDRNAIHAGFLSSPLLAAAPRQTVERAMTMFSDDPNARPAALPWIRSLRQAATTTGPHSTGFPTTVLSGAPYVPQIPEQVTPVEQPRGLRRFVLAAGAIVLGLVAATAFGATVLSGAFADDPTGEVPTSTSPILPTTDAPTTVPNVGQQSAPPPSPPTSTAPASRYRQVFASEVLEIPAGACPFQTDVDLDEPRVNADSRSDTELSYGRPCGGDDYQIIQFLQLAAQADAATDSPEECDLGIRRAPLGNSYVDAAEGGRFCVSTSEDRMALIQVGPLSGSSERPTVTITVSLWATT
ncbi:serine/threonine protein kinase [Pseudonocardia broussonetiae]|uniref:non-specific serine/threonine protein kinase n=1 Tax=Pseudonocardia broussonetiae TaxID=2736640 RepID=A0A6M6JB21_9PSEU|nr:serine/threonine-protein kinase [Pseudonocardia broussonetiae]QJY45128.1 serine/threonine protein kinase [Pseudonocardia broussonetiae]